MHRVVRMSQIACLAIILGPLAAAQAHFPWIVIDGQKHLRYFFGESAGERDYHLPDSLADSKVSHIGADGKAQPVPVEAFEEKNFVGLRSTAPVADSGLFFSSKVYGLFHGAQLTYYTYHLASAKPSDWPKEALKDIEFQALPSAQEGDFAVKLILQDKPLANAKVQLFRTEGEAGDEATTDKDGLAVFKGIPADKGLVGILVGYTDKAASGEFEGTKYKGAAKYLTLTFPHEIKQETKAAGIQALPKLPEALASFGAAVDGSWLYVYSGHLGTPHDHCKECLSPHFRRLNLASAGEWEELPTGPALQGVPLVPAGGKLYRVGGLSARNARGEDENLASVASVGCFDPATQKWSDAPALPEARSSHDAIAHGSVIYVVGGWNLDGENKTWLPTAYKMDVAAESPSWTALPETPFRRRALATVIAGDKLYAIGGMGDNNKPSAEVDIFDLKSETWSKGPAVPCGMMKAFGVAATTHEDAVIVSTHDKQIHRLKSDGATWEKIGELPEGRIFHRLLPMPSGEFVVSGGASGFEKQLDSVLALKLPQ